MECRHHYRKHLQYPGQSGDTIQPRHGPLMAYRPDFITDVPGGLLALRSTSPCDAKLRGLVDDLNPVDGGFPYSRTHYEPRPFGREMEKGMLGRFTIGVQFTLQLEQVGQSRRRTVFSSWKSCSRLPMESAIKSRPNRTAGKMTVGYRTGETTKLASTSARPASIKL